MASKSDFKALLILNRDITCTNWKKESSIWQAITSVEKNDTSTSHLFTGQAGEAVLALDIGKLTGDDSAKNLID